MNRAASNAIIISPSGNYYGSEQVLWDYLGYSRVRHKVLVYGKGILFRNLKRKEVDVHAFYFVPALYFQLFFLCIFGNVRVIYVNEAGHSRYVQLFARLFRTVRFIIHVRIVEDTQRDRWNRKSENLTVIVVSKFIQAKLDIASTLLYDPYPFRYSCPVQVAKSSDTFNIGIIGRISETKGIGTVLKLIQHVRNSGAEGKLKFIFFGEVMPANNGLWEKLHLFSNVELAGFVEDKQSIFDSLHCVLHAAENEPLGRVFLEAIDHGIPFIGIDQGGIGEIASLVGLENLMVANVPDTIAETLYTKIQMVRTNYQDVVRQMLTAKGKAEMNFNIAEYTNRLDNLLSAQ